ncbi:MAG: MFS transporter [Chloroflexi bacterium]|nr:MFS transporter [Chloroflexota bacterium]
MTQQVVRSAEPGAAVGTAPTNKTTALFVVALGSILTPLSGTAVNMALPKLGADLKLDAVLLSWVATIYLVTIAVFLIPLGRVADIYGRKKAFTAGIVICSLSSLLAGLSTSGGMLILFRAMQGLGGGLFIGSGFAILTSVFPVNERGKALGIVTAATYIGLTMGPPVAGLLTERFGWRSVFLMNVPIALTAVVMVLWKLKGEWADARGEKLDLGGSAAYGLGVLILMYGMSLLPKAGGAWFIAAGILSLVGFMWWETKAKSVVLDVRLFRGNKLLLFSNLAALINYSASFVVIFLLGLYLQYIKGLNPEEAGLVMIVQPACMMAISPLAGPLSDRIEPRVVATAGMGLATIGIVMLIFVGPETGMTTIFALQAILGIGFGLFSSPNTNAVMSSVEKKAYGVASSILSTMRVVGQMTSMGIAAVLFSVYMGRVEITPEVYPQFLAAFKMTFIVSSSLCVVGIFTSLARGNRPDHI